MSKIINFNLNTFSIILEENSSSWINQFTYSKKSHFLFFQENNYDIDLYGKKIGPEESDVRIYQNLLIYAFVKNNIEKGSKILEIGREYSPVFEKLKLDYECWKFVKPDELGKNFEEIETISDDILIQPENQDLIRFPRYYFDLAYSISVFENTPQTEINFRNITLNIRNILRPLGYSINCFANVINKDNVVWSNKLINYIYGKESTINKNIDGTIILKDKELFIISENYYNKHIKSYTNLSYKDFGKIFSYNLIWRNLKFISNYNFQDFTYSKKSHFKLFNGFNISKNVFGKDIDDNEYDISKYQELLVYSYIKDNIKKGSKILRLGTAGDNLINVLKDEYEFYTLEFTDELSKRIFIMDNYEFQFIKDNEGKQAMFFPLKYFDFIFSISGFEEVEDNLKVFTNIIININTFKNEFALVFLSFNNVFYNGVAQSNSFLYFLFKNVEKFNKFSRHVFMLVDEDLYFESENNFYLNENNSSVTVNRICYNILWKTTPLLSTISETRPNDSLKINPAYVFHHIMKCGGTSVVNSLYNWFTIQFDYTDDPKGILKSLNDFHKYKYNLQNIYSDACLVSHFQFDGYLLPQRYPEVFQRTGEFRIFTFIRDPLKLMISLYYYGRGRIKETTSLIDYLNGHRNVLANFFPCNEKNYKEVLDRYFFIGIVEQMQESIDKLAELTGKKKINLPLLNISEKDDQASKLSPEFINVFKEYNNLDYKIYKYCLEKFSNI